jgi:inosose dehydratase
VRTFRERIDYVHLKDLDAAGGFVPLGQGVLDVAGVLQVLRDSDFDGWITVETDGWNGDPAAGARASRAQLKQLLSKEP